MDNIRGAALFIGNLVGPPATTGTINNTIFSDNSNSDDYAAGVGTFVNTSVTFTDCEVTDNQASNMGIMVLDTSGSELYSVNTSWRRNTPYDISLTDGGSLLGSFDMDGETDFTCSVTANDCY